MLKKLEDQKSYFFDTSKLLSFSKEDNILIIIYKKT
tara:strand:- start:224 stop:331 length:108 start_codon:yes stop_codon:yes gene_type:complete